MAASKTQGSYGFMPVSRNPALGPVAGLHRVNVTEGRANAFRGRCRGTSLVSMSQTHDLWGGVKTALLLNTTAGVGDLHGFVDTFGFPGRGSRCRERERPLAIELQGADQRMGLCGAASSALRGSLSVCRNGHRLDEVGRGQNGGEGAWQRDTQQRI